jgi:hypothetical protein
MRFMLKAICYCILLLSFESCSKDDPECGCDGSTRRVLENIQARYVGKGTFVFQDTLAGYLRVYP